MYLQKFAKRVLLGLVGLTLMGCTTGGQRPDTNILRAMNTKNFDIQQSKPLLPANYTFGSGDELIITFMNLPNATSKRYTLQPGDILLVEFQGNEHLNRNLVVGPDGYIIAPYIGEIKAAAKSISALKNKMAKKYADGGFLNGTTLTVSLARFNSRYKEIQKLNTDGRTGYGRTLSVEIDGCIRLPLAGSILASGKTVDEVEQTIQSVYSTFFPSASILIDIKQIRSNVVYLLGYVNRPGRLNMTSPTSVTQAISQAGGFQETAGLDSVVIIRRGPDGKPQYHLCDLNAVLTKGNMTNDILLQRYDVVYVPPSSIHELNKAVQYGIRNMLPLQSNMNAGFTYLYGPASEDN